MTKNYINNKDLYNALVEHRKNYDEAISKGEEPPEIPRYIAESFQSIGRGLAKTYRWSGYTWKEDMISLGIIDCVKYWRTFDPASGKNPFAFFTTVFKSAFYRYCNKEEREKYIKCKMTINKGIDNKFDVVGDDDSDDVPQQIDTYENIGEFVASYEARLQEQKLKNKKQEAKPQQEKKESTKDLF